mgnify:CR=1 FL=1
MGQKIIMSETTYQSRQERINADADKVYASLGNLNNIEKVKHLLPPDKISELEYDTDFIRFKVDGLGQKICIRIVDREENKTLKFGAEDSPVTANFWIQLKQVEPSDTRILLTLKADIPIMFKMMLDSKIQQGIDDAARMIAQMPFNEWTNN